MDTIQRFPAGKLAIGLVLVTIGVAAFLDAINVWETGPYWRYWPLLLIAIGAANAFDAIRRRKSDGSWFLLGVGVWFLIGNFHLFGLSHGKAFPLAVIFTGLGAILHAVIDAPVKKEDEHERQQ